MTHSKDNLVILLGVCLLSVLSGCGEFFQKRTTELESKAVIRDISRVKENPHVGNPLPQVYLDGPKRLPVEGGVKLFYFTKYLPAGDFAATIQQLGFSVSFHPSTNQLIIHCANDAECDQLLAYLEMTDVPPIQVHIDCLILERFGDVTKDWESTLLIENFLGQEVTLGQAKYPGAAFPGASLRESKRADFGLDFGYWMNKGVSGHQVRLLVDALESRGYLKILMNPTLETVNGKTARVEIRDNAPVEKTVTEANNNIYTVTEYKWVADSLSVTPFVYADGYIGLKTDIILGSKSKPEGVVQTSIITERSISVAENRIEPGKSLVIGGMRKAENRSVIRGIPFFKDLPIIGILFSSKDFEENATEVIFILTPSVSSGGVDYKKMADVIREKFESPDDTHDWDELVTDPMGTKTYSDVVSKEADLAESETIRLQVQTDEVKRQALAAQLRAAKATAESEAMKAKAQETQALIDQAQAQKAAAEAQAQAAAKEMQVQQAKMTQTQEEIQKAAQEAEAAKAQVLKAQEELQKAQQRANELTQEAEKTRQQVESIQKQIQELESQASGAEGGTQ